MKAGLIRFTLVGLTIQAINNSRATHTGRSEAHASLIEMGARPNKQVSLLSYLL